MAPSQHSAESLTGERAYRLIYDQGNLSSGCIAFKLGTKTLDSKTQTDFLNAMGFRMGGRPADFTEMLHPPELKDEEKVQLKKTADEKLKHSFHQTNLRSERRRRRRAAEEERLRKLKRPSYRLPAGQPTAIDLQSKTTDQYLRKRRNRLIRKVSRVGKVIAQSNISKWMRKQQASGVDNSQRAARKMMTHPAVQDWFREIDLKKTGEVDSQELALMFFVFGYDGPEAWRMSCEMLNKANTGLGAKLSLDAFALMLNTFPFFKGVIAWSHDLIKKAGQTVTFEANHLMVRVSETSIVTPMTPSGSKCVWTTFEQFFMNWKRRRNLLLVGRMPGRPGTTSGMAAERMIAGIVGKQPAHLVVHAAPNKVIAPIKKLSDKDKAYLAEQRSQKLRRRGNVLMRERDRLQKALRLTPTPRHHTPPFRRNSSRPSTLVSTPKQRSKATPRADNHSAMTATQMMMQILGH